MSKAQTQNDGIFAKVKKAIYIILGTISLVLGFIGLFLPVLPTTPLVIFAAACYFRGSNMLHAWILRSKWFGKIIRNYQSGKGLTRNTKIRAICLMWTMIIISAVFYIDNYLIRMIMLGIALIVSIYLIRLPTYMD